MSEKPGRIDEAMLHAFVDGRLDEERHRTVERFLADNPAEAARVEAWRRQNQGLLALVGEVGREPVPARLAPRRLLAERRRRRLPMAAALAGLLVGGAAGWLGHGWVNAGASADRRLADEAIAAHRMYTAEVRHAVEVRAEEAHLVTWLSRRLGHDLRVPDLNTAGFALVGGRLLPSDAGPAAQFMYEDASGRRLTLYVGQNAQPRSTAFRYQAEGPVSAFYWIDGPLGYVLIGEAERDRLLQLARLVYDQLER